MEVHWVHEAECGRTFDSVTFGDGSGLYSFSSASRRCGFGIIAATRDRDGHLIKRTGALGPIPGKQSVPVAELFALLVYLRYAAPCKGKYIFITDCSYISDGFWKGKQVVTNGWSKNAGLWRELF